MKLKSITLLAAMIVVGNLYAQEEEPKIQSGGIQQRAIILASPQGGDFPAPVEIQSFEFSGDISNGPGASWSFSTGGPEMMMHAAPVGGGGSGLMGLLQNKSVRDEIELVDDQYKKMQDFYKKRQGEIMKEVNALISPALSGGGKKSNSSVKLQGSKLKELIQKQQEEAEKKLKELLLPHQTKDLNRFLTRLQ